MGEQKINATQLAKRAGLSRYAIYELYHERTKGIEFETLAKLCQALDCSVGELLEYVPEAD
jgi:putative transcriptional regulator